MADEFDDVEPNGGERAREILLRKLSGLMRQFRVVLYTEHKDEDGNWVPDERLYFGHGYNVDNRAGALCIHEYTLSENNEAQLQIRHTLHASCWREVHEIIEVRQPALIRLVN